MLHKPNTKAFWYALTPKTSHPFQFREHLSLALVHKATKALEGFQVRVLRSALWVDIQWVCTWATALEGVTAFQLASMG